MPTTGGRNEDRPLQLAVTLPATDLERAKAWYASVLQLDPSGPTGNDALWYDVGGTRLMLYISRFAGTNQATAAAFGVDDVEATVAQLRARGAVLEDYDFGDDLRTVDGIATMPDGMKTAWLKDSEGNILNIGPADIAGGGAST